VLAQPGDEAVDQVGKPVARRFDECGRGALALQVVRQVAVRDGPVIGIGQLFANRQGTTLLGDGLGHIALPGEQIGEGAERFGPPGGVVLEQLEAIFQLRPGLAEAAWQLREHVGPVEPRGPDVLRSPLQRMLDLQNRIEPSQGRFPILADIVGTPGDVQRAEVRAGEDLGIRGLGNRLAGAVPPPPASHLRQPRLDLRQRPGHVALHNVDPQGLQLVGNDMDGRAARLLMRLGRFHVPLLRGGQVADTNKGGRPVAGDRGQVPPRLPGAVAAGLRGRAGLGGSLFEEREAGVGATAPL